MAKTKVLISFAVTTKLICVFVFAYAKSRFSHNEAQIVVLIQTIDSLMVFLKDLKKIVLRKKKQTTKTHAKLPRNLRTNVIKDTG